MDANEVAKGEKISPALVTAIEKSMFCVVVFSENYASSIWCLEELVKILDCKNTMEQTVLPIFYNVDPSDVREQKGSFEKALVKHEQKLKEPEKVQIWGRLSLKLPVYPAGIPGIGNHSTLRNS